MDAATLKTRLNSQTAFKENVWEPYFRTCDKYYNGYKQNRLWRTTKKPRANTKLHVTSDVIETLYSRFIFALFHAGGENFFDVVSSDTAAAQGFTERLNHILYAPIDASGRTSFFALRRAVRYILTYGLGFTGISSNLELQRSVISVISPWDIFWDASNSVWIDDSEWISLKTCIPFRNLESYRGVPGYKIPSRKSLNMMERDYRHKSNATNADFGKSENAIRALGSDATGTTSSGRDPDEIDVYRMTSKEKVYWLLDYDSDPQVIFEGPNTLGFQPYCSGVFRPVLDAFGGRSVTHLISGEHDLQQSLANTSLDMLDLAVEPPRTSGPGNKKNKTWSPAAIIDTDENGRDKVLESRFPGELFAVSSESRARMLRTGGTNEMSLGGTPQPSNANRTLGGMQLQSAASNERHFAAMSDVETMLVVPTLTKALLADIPSQKSAKQFLQGRTTSGQPTEVDPQAVAEKPATISVRGATRMVGVERLGGLIQTVMQFMYDPQVQAGAAKAGFTPDFETLNRFFVQATGTAEKFDFYKRLTPEQSQQLQQTEMQGEQMKAQSRMASDQIKAQTQLKLEELRQQGMSEERILKLLDVLASNTDQAINPGPGPNS